MKFLLFLTLLTIKAEIFVPDNLLDTESDLANVESDKDPFVSSSLSNEPDNKEMMTLTELVNASKKKESDDDKKDDSSSESSSEKATNTSDKTKSEYKIDKPEQTKHKNHLKKRDKKVKEGEPFWTPVYIENKLKDALVNVKTVTIIESLTDSNQKEYPAVTKTSTDSAADPYIKIQLPSKIATKNSTSQTPAKTEENKSKAKVDHKTHKHSTILVNPQKSKDQSQSASSSTPAASTKVFTSKSASQKTDNKSVSKESIQPKKTTKDVKDDKIVKSSSVKVSTSSQKASTKNDGSLGSIFNVLKTMPFGGTENKSLYVEGNFKFPKEKELKSQIYKMSGYISSA